MYLKICILGEILDIFQLIKPTALDFCGGWAVTNRISLHTLSVSLMDGR